MGIIPAGSGNGLARHLKIPLNIKSALERIGKFEPKIYDTGKVNSKFFVGTCGFGFDGYIAHLFDNFGKRGFVSYAKLIAREYQAYEPTEFEVSFDGETLIKQSLVCAIANSSQFGNGFTISPTSSMQDGKFEIIFIDKFPLIDTPAIGTRFFTQSIHNSKYFTAVDFCESATIKVKSDGKVHYHLDGEPRTNGEDFSIEINNASLNIL
jgi:diacylglycerol kinase family enzyme